MQDDTCPMCEGSRALDFDFTFAFQPIVHLKSQTVFAYEALVRPLGGGSAAQILSQVGENELYAFDQAARTKAIALASRLMPGGSARISLNIMPNAVYEPARCLRTTLRAARENDFALERLMFEITEQERVGDVAHLTRIVKHYADSGFTMAIDDFGAGFAGLGLLAEFVPHILKLDMALVRGIDTDARRQAIVRGILQTASALDVTVLAEGVETAEELTWLSAAGIDLFQGYYLAKPALEALPDVDFAGLQPSLPRPTPLAACPPVHGNASAH